jgi:hypothetical protein
MRRNFIGSDRFLPYVFDLGSGQLTQHIRLIRVSNDFKKGVRGGERVRVRTAVITSFDPAKDLIRGCESSNRYHDFVPAKGLFRRLRRCICTNDHIDHTQDTKSNHNL